MRVQLLSLAVPGSQFLAIPRRQNPPRILHYNGSTWMPWTNKKDVGGDQLLAIWGDGRNLWTVSAQGNIFRYQ